MKTDCSSDLPKVPKLYWGPGLKSPLGQVKYFLPFIEINSYVENICLYSYLSGETKYQKMVKNGLSLN